MAMDPATSQAFQKLLARLATRQTLPRRSQFMASLEGAIRVMSKLPATVRPLDGRRLPGGLVRLPDTPYTLILPDLHARRDFVTATLAWSPDGITTVFEDLVAGRATVVCVGDAFHAEVRGRLRWQAAFVEFEGGFKQHREMDQEMIESLGLVEILARLKMAFPRHFHFLKGNHENVANEEGEGNHPFGKFAMEGQMVRHWILQFLGEDVFGMIYSYEKCLPLAAVGKGFLITHCEPGRPLSPEEIINAYVDTDVIYQLTWIGNGEAEEGSVAATLEGFFPGNPHSRMFGGHRPVFSGRYSLRQDGRFVQVNNPDDRLVSLVRDIADFDPERDVHLIKDESR